MINRITKPPDMLCGSACLYYILNIMSNYNLDIAKDLKWITEIAFYIKKHTNLNILLSCHNSALYDDYLKIGENSDFEGFKTIRKFLFLGESIINLPLNKTVLSDGLKKNNIYILNVKSSILNKDNSLLGGHYVCLLDETVNNFKILNPKSDSLVLEFISKNQLQNSFESFGSWCIKINKSEI